MLEEKTLKNVNFVHIKKYVRSEKDPKRIGIRIPKDVKSLIRYYLKVGSIIDWKVGSRSEINSFGSATQLWMPLKTLIHIYKGFFFLP